jgi:hypothetical protein
MEKSEAKKDETPEIRVPENEPAAEKDICLVCEKEIEKNSVKKMFGLTLCSECHANLVKMPSIKPRPDNTESDNPLNPSDSFGKQAVAQVRVDLKSTVQCHSCGRQIPAMGSKQFDSHPYCPDCYFRLPEIKAREPKPLKSIIAEQPLELKDKDRNHIEVAEDNKEMAVCQACQRRVSSVSLKTIEGFEICTACLSADKETALEIARTRHRKALEKMRQELEDL